MRTEERGNMFADQIKHFAITCEVTVLAGII